MPDRTLRILLPLTLLCLAVLAFAGGGLWAPAHAGTIRWTNTGTGSWDESSNWNPSQLPTSSDDTYIDNGGTATVGSTEIGSANLLYIGYNDTGVLSITNGGAVTSASTIFLGYYSDSSGTVTVDGSGSKLESEGELLVGRRSTGVLNILDGGTVTSTSDIYLGGEDSSNGTGTVTVDGAGSKLESGGQLLVGRLSTGVLNILNGGTVTSVSDIKVGEAVNGNGSVCVGKDSSLTTNTKVTIRGRGVLSGIGTIIVKNSVAPTVFVDTLGTISAGDAYGQIDTLNIGSVPDVTNLSLEHYGVLHVDFNNEGNVAGTNHDLIKVQGDVSFGDVLVISLSTLATAMDTDAGRTIITATGSMTSTAPTGWLRLNGLSLNNSRAAGSTVTLAVNGKDLQIIGMTPAGVDNKKVTWSSTTSIANWDIATENWTDDENPSTRIRFLDGDAVTFNINNDTKVRINGIRKTVAQMTVTGDDNLTIEGDIYADGSNQFTTLNGMSGKLTKGGTGTLTLNGDNSFKGGIDVADGTLQIGNGGSIASSTVVVNSGATFDISSAGGNAVVAGFDGVVGSGLITGGLQLNLTGGKTFALDLTGAVANSMTDSVLTVTGNGLLVDASTRFSMKNVDKALKKDEYIVLSSAASGAVTSEILLSGRKKYALELDVGKLLMRIAGISSFVDATNDFLGSAAPGNVNIQNGGAYLDWLLTQPYGELPDPGMEVIEDYFTDITDNLTNLSAAQSELQRMYGSYSAYGNQALQDDANRFRRRWRKQNHFFLDGFVFADLLQCATSAAADSGPASPRYDARECVPAGISRVWTGGFGAWAKQDARSDLSGYDYDSYGLALGYEYTCDRLHLGVAAAYSRGDLEVDDLGYKNKPDVLNLALYGAYVHDSGVYAEGGLGYGHAWNDYRTDMLLGGRKTGKYGSDIFSADLELGYIARLACGYNLIPSVGLEYDYIRNDSWTEKVVNSAAPANRFASGHDHALDIPVGLRFNKVFVLGGGTTIVPEVRASYVYTANKSTPTIQSGFAGAPGTATMRGVDPGRSHWRFGAGLSGQINRRVDFQLEYEYETRSGFKGHNLNASVGLAF